MTERFPILVTGGAGYIGSHVTYALLAAGWPVVVLDNLSTGFLEAVPEGVVFVQGDVGDARCVARTVSDHRIGAVMHFAGSIQVGESVTVPLDYYGNNTCASRTLIDTVIKAGVSKFIFSSTAAVYGDPTEMPLHEQSPTLPVNPYGASKLMTEWMLRDAAAAHGLRYVALRYFNVAGADPQGRSGQRSKVATHLIKIACEVAVGKRTGMEIFGTDYATPDGTCIRDYIHVTDLAEAHVRALDHLAAGGETLVANCGYGRGFSVRQVLAAMARAAGGPINAKEGPRREGDSVELIADSTLIRSRLGWVPQHDDLDTIVADALRWERKLS